MTTRFLKTFPQPPLLHALPRGRITVAFGLSSPSEMQPVPELVGYAAARRFSLRPKCATAEHTMNEPVSPANITK